MENQQLYLVSDNIFRLLILHNVMSFFHFVVCNLYYDEDLSGTFLEVENTSSAPGKYGTPQLSYVEQMYYDVIIICNRPRWLSWMRRPTGDQEVAGSTPAEVGNILSWRLIMKYFLRSFFPFR